MATLISAEQADAEYRQRHVDDANAYLRLASEIAAKESLRFCAITVGVAGTGKSTVADLIATQWNAVHLKTDTISRELAEVGPTDRTGFAVREGMYTAGMSRRTYDEMRRRAQQELSAGNSMVMDGTHLQRRHRKTSLDQGRYAGVFTIIVECTLEEAEAHSRLGSRYSSGTSESEGRPEVYTEQVQT